MSLSENKQNIAIFVNSFDEYSDLWDIFWDIFNKYWPDCSLKKYLVSNEIRYERKGIINIRTGKEVNWFERTIKAMKSVNEDYLVLFLEDYFLSKTVNFLDIYSIVERMEKEDIFFYRLSMREGFPKNQGFIVVPEGSDYPLTLQLAIWKKDVFVKIINELHDSGCKSPWDFEVYLKNDYRYCPPINGILQGIRFDNRDILGYKNGVLRGRWFPDIRKFYIHQGIDFSKSSRDIMPYLQNLRYKIICFISSNFSDNHKTKLKIFLTKLKIKSTI